MPRTLDSTLRLSGGDVAAITAASVQSAVVPANIQEVRVVSTTNCWIQIGQAPTAVAGADGNSYLPSGVVEYFHVSPGQQVAAIRDSADGSLSVSWMTR